MANTDLSGYSPTIQREVEGLDILQLDTEQAIRVGSVNGKEMSAANYVDMYKLLFRIAAQRQLLLGLTPTIGGNDDR